jgi:hypothetical protein
MRACRIIRPSRERARWLDVEMHQAVFQWVLSNAGREEGAEGTTIGVDATTRWRAN